MVMDRETLMAQRDDQLARTDTGWPERWWGKITKVTLGYGYQPWRALWFLAAVVAVSCVLAVQPSVGPATSHTQAGSSLLSAPTPDVLDPGGDHSHSR